VAAAGALMLAVGSGSAAASAGRPTQSDFSAGSQNVSVTPNDFWSRVAVDPAGDAAPCG
jgi:hypothetical protein